MRLSWPGILLLTLVALGAAVLLQWCGASDKTALSKASDVTGVCCAAGAGSTRVAMPRSFDRSASATAPVAHWDGEHDPLGMVWIPGGEFIMGAAPNDPLALPHESPAHRVHLDGFWMDVTEVTNRHFRKFVDETGYVTTAERAVDWETMRTQLPPDTLRPPDEALAPGSLVFTPPSKSVPLNDATRWWTWTVGASWQHPEGPGSDLNARDDHPVVHVSHEDAMAYCAWAGKRLPSEAEWEFAARGGLDRKINTWGDEPVDPTRANIWQGAFPYKNLVEDGYAATAPVGRFPPNGYGLHDMAGNVWEWCLERYRPDEYAHRVVTAEPGRVTLNPRGPTNNAAAARFVMRGGSYLCHDSYCASYRPSARMAATGETSLGHVGFRCVMTRRTAE